jgi:hypothetical protein
MSRAIIIRTDLCVPELDIVPMYLPGPRERGASVDRALTAAFAAAVARRGFVIMTARGRRELIAAERITFT